MTDDTIPEDRPGRSPENETARERWYARLIQRFGLKPKDTIRGDLEDALAETLHNPSFSPQEREMLKNVLGFHRIRVDDVMVPRADIVAVPADTSLGDLLGMFRTAGHSRLPVYGETLDDPRGMVHIRDFLDYLATRAEAGTSRRRGNREERPPNLGEVDLSVTLGTAKILRPVLYAPPSMPAIDLLVRMQATRTHMALVIDEYGGTDGLVSIEDLVEMVVGDIEDEHDETDARLILQGEGDAFLADARATLEEVSEALKVDLAVGEMAEEVDTLGGLIVTLAGRVPSRGELIAGPDNLEFEVLDADPRKVKRLRIHRREAAPAAPALAERTAADRSEPESASLAGAPPPVSGEPEPVVSPPASVQPLSQGDRPKAGAPLL